MSYTPAAEIPPPWERPTEATAPPEFSPPPPPRRPRRWLPLSLFLATCFCAFLAQGGLIYFDLLYQELFAINPEPIPPEWFTHFFWRGITYAAALMTILVFHEMGHWLQMRRYKIQGSLPYFIPCPFPPFGTFGAVIAMRSGQGNIREIFDVGISGPLAGLVPTFGFCLYGVLTAEPTPIAEANELCNPPLLLQWFETFRATPVPSDCTLYDLWFISPYLFAGWFGLLLTAINLAPIGQLDGGHIFYGLLRGKSKYFSKLLLLSAVALVVVDWETYYMWAVLLGLIIVMGAEHPRTRDDTVPLGRFRVVLGIATLLLLIVIFSPQPFWWRS